MVGRLAPQFNRGLSFTNPHGRNFLRRIDFSYRASPEIISVTPPEPSS